MSLYLLLNIIAVSAPLLLSFEKRDIHFVGRWKYLFPAIILTMCIFIPWDVWFTGMGIWGFNPRYLSGTYLFNLPVEEWLFFVTVPFACVFTYEATNKHIKKDLLGPYTGWITLVLSGFLIITAVLHIDRYYTFVTFLATAFLLLLHQFVFKSRYLGRFYVAYLFILFPFTLMNGILTGSFIEEPIVWYNNSENMGIRYFTIPFEDLFYGMLLVLINITIYERLRILLPGRKS